MNDETCVCGHTPNAHPKGGPCAPIYCPCGRLEIATDTINIGYLSFPPEVQRAIEAAAVEAASVDGRHEFYPGGAGGLCGWRGCLRAPYHPFHLTPPQAVGDRDAHEPGCSGRHHQDGTEDRIPPTVTADHLTAIRINLPTWHTDPGWSRETITRLVDALDEARAKHEAYLSSFSRDLNHSRAETLAVGARAEAAEHERDQACDLAADRYHALRITEHERDDARAEAVDWREHLDSAETALARAHGLADTWDGEDHATTGCITGPGRAAILRAVLAGAPATSDGIQESKVPASHEYRPGHKATPP